MTLADLMREPKRHRGFLGVADAVINVDLLQTAFWMTIGDEAVYVLRMTDGFSIDFRGEKAKQAEATLTGAYIFG